MVVEIETLEELEPRLAAGDLDDTVVGGLDLVPVADRLARASVRGTVFLGCRLPRDLRADLPERGAVVFPRLEGFPFRPYRGALYTPEELFDGFDPEDPCTYCRTLDARVYAHWHATGGSSPGGVLEALARRLHDQAVGVELHRFLDAWAAGAGDGAAARVVGVMGGHALSRRAAAFREVARLAHRLARAGYLLVSGGGPGAMEATNLGAWLAPLDAAAVDEAVDGLGGAPTYRDEGWLAAAFRVKASFRERLPEAGASVGIPTWHYGHEPPNAFATHVAKYFANSLREEGLITVARGGLVFAPGNAGTIQEIFQDAAQNRYAVTGEVSPMVFLDRHYWQEEKPVYPLLRHLARGYRYGELLTICDRADEAADFLLAHPPEPSTTPAWSFCGQHCGGEGGDAGAGGEGGAGNGGGDIDPGGTGAATARPGAGPETG